MLAWQYHGGLGWGSGGRNEAPGSEIKDSLLLTATAVARVLAFFHQFSKPHFLWATWKGLQSQLYYRREFWDRELKSFIRSVSMPALCSRRKYYLYYRGPLAYLPCSRGDSISSFQGWKQTCLLLQRKTLSVSSKIACYMNKRWILSKAFSVSIEMIMCVFPL